MDWHGARGDWAMPKVRGVLAQSGTDVKSILKMPRRVALGEDLLTWDLSRNGAYSVKSGYYYAMMHLHDNSHLRVDGNWKAIWSLKVPIKIRILLWLIARGCLPTRDCLQRKGVNYGSLCHWCNEFESEWHMFFAFPKAREVWETAGLWNVIDSMYEKVDGAKELLFELLNLINKDDLSSLPAGFWCIWKWRNDAIWNENERPSGLAFHDAKSFVASWLHRNNVGRDATTSTAPPPRARYITSSLWVMLIGSRPPTTGRIKCNIDGAWFAQQQQVGLGICIHDSLGRFMVTKTFYFDGFLQPHEIEATGLFEALRWLIQRGAHYVDIELDCKQVVDTFNSGLVLANEFGAIISSCKNSFLAITKLHHQLY